MKFIFVFILTILITCAKTGKEDPRSPSAETNSEMKTESTQEKSRISENKISHTEKTSEPYKETDSAPENKSMNQPKPASIQEIQFEDLNHFLYSLTQEKFLLISDQKKMDEIYAIIHQENGGGRMAPIPTISEDESYLIFKPELKNTNDIEILKIYLKNGILNVDVKPFNDPQRSSASRVSPNVMVKLHSRVSSKRININYK
ncbi:MULTISPECIES: hypothetical protein [Chryseobacterium]|uniref:hypothetical protein n=1 Tax=Chryseobacterium sp. R2A-55 TaxID=2744445 RepID=UPI001F1FB7CD|nr:hypothetical protein [Chryseobacterium sp. R2A-55]